MKNYIIVDLEATCWQSGTTPLRQEIIEIGAVQLDAAKWKLRNEYSRFVKPVAEPVLSDFCTALTTITQAQVEQAETFPVVFAEFVDWIGTDPFTLCSWGDYDLIQFKADCQRHQIELPETFERHINLKKAFAQIYRKKPGGMKSALAMLGLPLEGQHHRALDDARNIAEMAKLILPKLAGKRKNL